MNTESHFSVFDCHITQSWFRGFRATEAVWRHGNNHNVSPKCLKGLLRSPPLTNAVDIYG